MHRDVTLDKIGYMMDRIGGSDEITADDLESMIHKVFVGSFELEHGFEADLIRELVNARACLIEQDAEESASWPDVLPLHANWDTKVLRELARKEVAHHLVVCDQIRAEMAKRGDANT